jgi:hypothetical protein
MKARRLAWAGFGLWATLTAVACAGHLADRNPEDAVFALALGGLAWAGALLCARRPENAIGRLLLALALLLAFSLAAEGVYVNLGDEQHPSLATRLLVWVNEWTSPIWFGLLFLLPLLFPSGHVPSRRWLPLLWLVVVGIVAGVLEAAFVHEHLEWAHVRNPLLVGGPAHDALQALAPVLDLLLVVAVICPLAGLVVRLRRSSGAERQQLKWYASAVALFLAGLGVAAVGFVSGSDLVANAGFAVFYAAIFVALPLAIATAILRHRLYDIDVVIRRTLVYGALTVTLGVTYLALVLLIGVTIGRSGFATAVSTLAVAALFGPLRARIQAAVDRRFYRSRYDAARTLEAFGAHLRDELDLDSVAADVRAVVRDTVQPAHVSLWLRSGR